jgi:aspartyl-tRNA(Asn)/glutamyl-tRNA(Gln) amidotransferase subunit A
MPFTNFSAVQLAQQIKSKKVSCREVTDAFLDRIEKVEPKVHAFISVLNDEARKRADALDKRLASGDDIGPLGGVPVAVKDLLCTKGVRTTCASKIL